MPKAKPGAKKLNLATLDMDAFVQAYEARLRAIDGYAQLPEPERAQIARMVIDFVVAAIERDDEQAFVNFVQARVHSHIERGWAATSFSQALFALEELLIAQVDDVETARFTWQALARARTIASEAMAQMFQQPADQLAQRRLAQLRAVTELTAQLSAEHDVDALCRLAVELGREHLDLERMSIWLQDGPPGHFRGTFGIDEQGQTRDEHEARIELTPDTVPGQVAFGALPEAMVYEPLRDHLGNVVGEGWHVVVSVEGSAGDVIGLLVADRLLSQRAWDDYIIEILKLYALSIGRLLEGVSIRQQAEQETQSRLREMTLLNRVMMTTASSLEPNVVLETICRELTQAFGLPQAGVALLRDNDTMLEVVAHYRVDGESPALGMRISVADNPGSRYVIEKRVPLVISDVQGNDLERGFHEAAKALGIASMLLVPLVVRDRVIGTLGLDSFTTRSFSAEEIALAQSVAVSASQVLQSARLYEETQQSQQMLRLIVNTIPEMIFWKDRNSVYLGCNTRFAQASGVGSPADLVGMTDYDLAWTRQEADAFVADDRAVMEKAKPKLHIVEPQLQADGRRAWLETNKVPLFDAQNNVVGILGTAIDVTERVEALEAVRTSQQMLQSVIDSIPQTVFWKDRNLAFLGCNAAFARDARQSSPDEVVGKTDYDLWWADEAERFQAEDRAVLETGEAVINQENIRVYADGRRGWNLQNKIPLRDENGQVWAILGMSEDITERKETEIAVKEAEQRFRAIYQGSSDAVMLLTAQGFFDCNQRTLELFGFDRKEEFIRTHPDDVSPPLQPAGHDSASASRAHIETAYRQGSDRFEWVHRRRDGSDFPAEVLLSAFELGGEVVLQATVRDITERKRTEDALQENETRMTLALEAADAGVWELRPQSGETYLSPRWFALLGYAPDDLPHAFDSLIDLLHPEERESVRAQMMQHIENGADFALDFRMKARDGGYRWIHSIGKTIEWNDDGSTARLIGTHTDITDRMLRDRERIEMYVRRTEEVRISTQVAQEIAAAASLDELFERVVTVIKERFGYYHTQIFRYDPQQELMVLVAGYGEVGDRMRAAGHALPRGIGVVGAAAETGQSALATDTSIDPNWQPNPNLPDTRGELAVPIRWRDQVLGILDVQSSQAGALAEDDQLVLEGLCGQVAIAIRNAETLEQVQIFRQFAEASSQGFGLGDLQGNSIYVNPALCRMCGEPSPQAMLGKSMLEYYPPTYHQRLTEEVMPAVLREGRWAGELALLSRSGQVVPTMENFFLIRDQQGNPAYLADLMVDISGQKRAQAEMEERLQELNSLYRAISEEGWQTFREFATLPGGYLYDGVEPKRDDELWMPEIGEAVTTGGLTVTTFERPVAVAPLSAPGGEVVGALGVYDDPLHPLSSEDLNLIEQVANEVAQALESARLAQETQVALAETGALYQVSQALNTANTLDDVLYALRQGIELPALSLMSISLFDRVWGGDVAPEYIETVATWNAHGDEALDLIGSRYELAGFPTMRLLHPDEPLAIGDVQTDPILDQATRTLLAQEFGASSALFLPLVVAGQWIGFVDAYQTQPFEFRPAYLRRMMALVGQASVAIQSIQRLQETQTRAQREQQLREIAARLRIQPDVDSVLRALTRELGQALGRRAFVTVSGEGVARVASRSQTATRSQEDA